jgi:hypothetical protein
MIDKHGVAQNVLLSAPPASVAVLSLANVSLQDWVLMATLAWIATQAGWFFIQRIREFKTKKGCKDGKDTAL